jgi:hypothetical protein
LFFCFFERQLLSANVDGRTFIVETKSTVLRERTLHRRFVAEPQESKPTLVVQYHVVDRTKLSKALTQVLLRRWWHESVDEDGEFFNAVGGAGSAGLGSMAVIDASVLEVQSGSAVMW